MSVIDFKKELKHLYNPSQQAFTVVDVPPMNFLMIDGEGDPNTNPDYQQVMNTLYAMAYGLKFALKPQGVEYVVPPLEGLWWAEEMSKFSLLDKGDWLWTMMVMQPEPVTAELVERMRGEVARKKELPALARLRFETYHEGLAAQLMYVGAYADEGPTIARLHAFIAEQGYQPAGKHHEIYLGDPRRTPPEKLKTVIRQPVRIA
ncbi:MAG: hypothetical protein CVU38_10660 [Chloroflexi bacterium HGW-Chloroflexi-1]|nr:MAG: hypothetical protein CVU38_10660 [Chloroflexi bacterium HGW-Chloroflexi-1]